MSMTICLGAAAGVFLLASVVLALRLRRVRGQLLLIEDALADIRRGNINRRVLTRESDMTRQICCDINRIALDSQSRLIRQQQAELAYKRLMTSLSHDVKTPLASLVGYLEAIESGMVSGEERDAYLHVAYDKAQSLARLVERLFEWVKLDTGEQIFHFEQADVNELTRGVIADWIPQLESAGFDYDVEIPEDVCLLRLDPDAYARILQNLLQNAVIHSRGDHIALTVTEDAQGVEIAVQDNGVGITPEHLPHLFERMYQCDRSRAVRGNGLGLSIAKELARAMNGSIAVSSAPGEGTRATLRFSKAL